MQVTIKTLKQIFSKKLILIITALTLLLAISVVSYSSSNPIVNADPNTGGGYNLLPGDSFIAIDPASGAKFNVFITDRNINGRYNISVVPWNDLDEYLFTAYNLSGVWHFYFEKAWVSEPGRVITPARQQSAVRALESSGVFENYAPVNSTVSAGLRGRINATAPSVAATAPTTATVAFATTSPAPAYAFLPATSSAPVVHSSAKADATPKGQDSQFRLAANSNGQPVIMLASHDTSTGNSEYWKRADVSVKMPVLSDRSRQIKVDWGDGFSTDLSVPKGATNSAPGDGMTQPLYHWYANAYKASLDVCGHGPVKSYVIIKIYDTVDGGSHSMMFVYDKQPVNDCDTGGPTTT